MVEGILGLLGRIIGLVLERLPIRGDIRIRGESALDPGDPEDVRRASVSKVLAFATEHRGLRTAFVLLAGEDSPRTIPVTNAWMEKVRELGAKPTVKRY